MGARDPRRRYAGMEATDRPPPPAARPGPRVPRRRTAIRTLCAAPSPLPHASGRGRTHRTKYGGADANDPFWCPIVPSVVGMFK